MTGFLKISYLSMETVVEHGFLYTRQFSYFFVDITINGI